MVRIDMPEDRLTDYERAICYYTLPRVTHPVTFGLIVVYAVCLVEAFGYFLYGFLWDRPGVAKIGMFALGGMIVFGIVLFMVRALLNEYGRRKALAVARNVPDAVAGMDELPDPFAGHILMRHPIHNLGDLFPCTDSTGELFYFVETTPDGHWWKVKDAQDNEVLRVHVEARAGSFSLQSAAPSNLTIHVGEDEIAHIHRRFSFRTPTIQVECFHPERVDYIVERGGIFRDKRLVGRIYYIHDSAYLDIERAEFHDALLGLFVTMN